MDCQEFKNQVMDWVLGEIPEARGRDLEQHATRCAECGPRLARLMRTRDVLQNDWPHEEIPTSLVFAPTPVPARSGFWQWVLAAPRWADYSLASAAAFVLLIAVLSLGHAQFQFSDGRFSGSFGGAAKLTSSQAPSGQVSAVPVAMDEAAVRKLVNTEYATLSAQDRERYAAMLDQLSQQMRVQREADLSHIGVAFDQVKTVMWKDMQRNNAIVQYAAQRIANEVKN